MTEADDRYLAEIARDCERTLGVGISFFGVEREDRHGEVRLIARYQLDDTRWETTGSGDTVVAAHSALVSALLVDRVRVGFVSLVDAH